MGPIKSLSIPEWHLKLMEKVNITLLSGDIIGKSRHIKNQIYEIELAEEFELQSVENAIFNDAAVGNKGLTSAISDNIRYNPLAIARNILVEAHDNKTSWAAANHAGFHPFNALGPSPGDLGPCCFGKPQMLGTGMLQNTDALFPMARSFN